MTFNFNIYDVISVVFSLAVIPSAVYVLRSEKLKIGMSCLLVSFCGALTFAFIGSSIHELRSADKLKASYLRAMNPDLNDPASSYVLQAYTSLCKQGYEDTTQPCSVAVARNIADSSLTADQKARARQYVAHHANMPIESLK
jgi:hypothetical protein